MPFRELNPQGSTFRELGSTTPADTGNPSFWERERDIERTYFPAFASESDVVKSAIKETGKGLVGLAQAGTWVGSKIGIPGAEKATERLGEVYQAIDDADMLKSATLPQWLADFGGFAISYAVPSAWVGKLGTSAKVAIGAGKLGTVAKVGTIMSGEGALMGLTSENKERGMMTAVGAVGGGLGEVVSPTAGWAAKKLEQSSDALFNNTFLSKVSNDVKNSIIRLTGVSPKSFEMAGKTGKAELDDYVPSEDVIKRVRGYMDLVGIETGSDRQMAKSVNQVMKNSGEELDKMIYSSPIGNKKSPWTDLTQKFDTEKVSFVMSNPGNDKASTKAFDDIWKGFSERMEATGVTTKTAKVKDSQAFKRWYDDVYEKLNPNDPDFNAKEKAMKFIADYMRESVDTATGGATRELNKKLQTAVIFKSILDQQTKKSIGTAVPTILSRMLGGALLGETTGHIGIGALAGVAFSLDVMARNKGFQSATIDILDGTSKFFGSIAAKTDTEAISNAILGYVKNSPERAAVVNSVIRNAPEKTLSGFERYCKEAAERFRKNPTKIIDDIEAEVESVVKKVKKLSKPAQQPKAKIDKNKGVNVSHDKVKGKSK